MQQNKNTLSLCLLYVAFNSNKQQSLFLVVEENLGCFVCCLFILFLFGSRNVCTLFYAFLIFDINE